MKPSGCFIFKKYSNIYICRNMSRVTLEIEYQVCKPFKQVYKYLYKLKYVTMKLFGM